MKWLLTYITSSIGKKQVMGAAGLLLVLFVLGHMVGNLQLVLPFPPDPLEAQAAYNAYSNLLTKFKPALYYATIAGLAVIFMVHMYFAVALKLQNLKARGTARYAVEARKGKKQFPTFTMIWSGLAIAAFIIWHILTVRNGAYYYYINPEVADGAVVRDMWLTTVEVLGNPISTVFYMIVVVVLGFHTWHAISSAFQTMGINHQKWTPIIDMMGIAYCVVVAVGYGATAAGSYAVVNFDEKTIAVIEQVKNPSYQKALEALSKRPLEEQKMAAKLIAKNPERAKFIVEREGLHRPSFEKGNFHDKRKKFHKKGGHQRPVKQQEPARNLEENAEQLEIETEGGEE
ncbi:MAG: succinate dehydrogenase cytochrome b subunit [Fibromonadaceae bacterium]|jgi:succinate dehydrogenase / fumarate reductase cytochrome b subunit|nr:succinate dehydrogenase cytochrome b subunit [Fibromonadaceae bacterium]